MKKINYHKFRIILLFSMFLFNFEVYSQYNYAEGLQKTMFFYEAQRSGKMSVDSRINWRGDSHINDGQYLGVDLSGGWYDAGDNPKWNSTMAFAGSSLAWGGVEYRQGYIATNQMVHLKRNLKWVCDYFIKCHTYTDANDVSTYKIYTDIGKFLDDNREDKYWAPHEVMETIFPERLVAWGDKDAPATANVAAMAATLASSAVIFYQEGETDYADKLVLTAERLYKFATTYKQLKKKAPDGRIIDVGSGIDNGFEDQICWAAIWLDKAENAKNAAFGDFYKNEAKFWGDKIWHHPYYSFHGTEDFGPACFIELTKLFPENSAYKKNIEDILDRYLSAPRSNGGLAMLQNQWGTLRHSNNAAFIAFVYADGLSGSTKKTSYTTWAKGQLDYALGSNPQNRSYLVGFQPTGKSVVRNIHHSTAQGVYAGWQHKIPDAPEFDPYATHTLYGGLVGGPDYADAYQPDGVENYARSEVTLDYNAGITGNLARMSQVAPGGTVLDNFPQPETKQDEYFVEAVVNNSGTNFIEVKALLNNRSMWPAKTRDQMSFRYYYNLESGTTVTPSIVSSEGAVISQPTLYSGSIYYVTVSFPNVNIYPGGDDDAGKKTYRKEVNFRLTSSGSWDSSNDWSFAELPTAGKNLVKVSKMVVFDSSTKLFGDEPQGSGIAPIVSINPMETYEFTQGGSITVNITASSAGGDIQKSELFYNNIKVGESTTQPFSINFDNMPKGVLALTVKVTDGSGISSVSAPVNIRVNDNALYNYAEGLQKTLFFYEVQRSGRMSADSRINWRGDSHVNDGNYLGIDLSGGWYDAGDNPKWNSTMAFAGSSLAWGGVQYRQGYVSTGQMVHLKRNLQWVCDYFIKCHTYTDANDVSTYKIYTDIGKFLDDNREDRYWAPHEVMETIFPERLAAWGDKDAPATANVAAMAATLASSAVIFYQEGDRTYADKLVLTAERLYKFAITYKQLKKKAPDGRIIDVGSGIDNGFEDQICWAAIWLDKAEKAKNSAFGDFYKNEAKFWGDKVWFHPNYSFHGTEDFGPACFIELSKLFPENTAYKKNIEDILDRYLSAPRSSGGLALLQNQWGTLRHSNNAAFVAFSLR